MTFPARKLIETPRAPDGLFIQPRETGPDREQVELHNRERAVKHGKYADHHCGDPATVDPTANYLCYSCNNVQGVLCVLVSLKSLKGMKAPSCAEYEIQRTGDPEKWLKAISVDQAGFANAENGEGWGCKRCPYQEKAYEVDSLGNTIYCRVWECRVSLEVGCCRVNGAKAIPLPESWDTAMDPDDPWEQEGAKDADEDEDQEPAPAEPPKASAITEHIMRRRVSSNV